MGGSIPDLIGVWWPIFLVISLPGIGSVIAGVIYKIVASRLDHAIADELPETAGEWLQRKLAETGLDRQVRIIVAEGGDRYFAREKVIQLTPDTHFKADPVYWATAAHELGHARFHVHHPIGSALYALSVWLRWGFWRAGMAMIIGNILLGLPGVTALGFTFLGVALCLEVPVLVNEANASLWAGRMLRPSLAPRHFLAVRIDLLTAFGTYLIAFASRVIFLGWWDRIAELTGAGLRGAAAHPPTGWRLAVVAIASIAGVAYALARIVAGVSPASADDLMKRSPILFRLAELSWRLGLVLLLMLSWNGRTDPTYAWCVILAVFPAVTAVMFVLCLPSVLVLLPLYGVGRRLVARFGPVQLSQRFADARAGGARLIADGSATLMALLERRRREPRLPWRLAIVAELLYLPLLFVFWMR